MSRSLGQNELPTPNPAGGSFSHQGFLEADRDFKQPRFRGLEFRILAYRLGLASEATMCLGWLAGSGVRIFKPSPKSKVYRVYTNLLYLLQKAKREFYFSGNPPKGMSFNSWTVEGFGWSCAARALALAASFDHPACLSRNLTLHGPP